MALITSEELQVTYVTFFARPADKSGYEYWVQQEKEAALTAISGSDEAKLLYAGKGEASAIDQVYQNLLGRDSDPDGNYYWAKQLVRDADGNFTNLADVALQIATAAMNNPNKNPEGKLDSLAIQYKIDAAQKFTEALYQNPTAAVNYQSNQQAGKDLLKGIGADSTPATVDSAVNAAIVAAAQGGTSGEGTEFTFNNVATATLNDNTNIGFTPEKTYLSDANDKIIIESFDSLKDATVKIADPSVKDRDIITINLSADNKKDDFGIHWFGDPEIEGSGDSFKNIETIHIDVTGDVKAIAFAANIEGLKTIEVAGEVASELTMGDFEDASKVDASGITSGNVVLNAVGTNATELVGGAGNDNLWIGKEGGTLTGGMGKDTFHAGAALNKLVTITDIEKGDTIDLGDTVYQNIKKLTVTDASDETTFVAALQKQADNQGATGVYYAEFNGNTYLVANGLYGNDNSVEFDTYVFEKTGGNLATMTIPKGSAQLSHWGAHGDARLDNVRAFWDTKLTFGSGSSSGSGISATISAGTGTVGLTIGTNNTKDIDNFVHAPFINGTTNAEFYYGVASSSVASGSGYTVTGVMKDGVTYKLSDFESWSATSATISAGTHAEGTITGVVKGLKTEFSQHTYHITSSATVEIEGGSVKDSSIVFTGTFGTDYYNDDLIIKLAGSHNLETEASLTGGDLVFK